MKKENKTKKKEGAKKFLNIVLLFLFLTASIFGCLWTRLKVVETGYKLSNLTDRLKEARETNKKLKLEIATLKSLNRIEAVAKTDLGMISPSPNQVVIIK